MIKNDKQLQVTQDKIKSLKESIGKMKECPQTVWTKGSIIETTVLIQDLEKEVVEYLKKV